MPKSRTVSCAYFCSLAPKNSINMDNRLDKGKGPGSCSACVSLGKGGGELVG